VQPYRHVAARLLSSEKDFLQETFPGKKNSQGRDYQGGSMQESCGREGGVVKGVMSVA